MDDWGDPWAGNRADRSPEKEIANALGDAKRASILEGFGDEAHWDEGDASYDFEGWSNQFVTDQGEEGTPRDDVDKLRSQAEIVDVEPKHIADPDLTDGVSDTLKSRDETVSYQPALPNVEDDESRTVHLNTHSDVPFEDRTLLKSEAVDPTITLSSNSSSKIQAIVEELHPSTSFPQSIRTEGEVTADDASTKLSTSPSDVSQPVSSTAESPRTSFEDDHTFPSIPKAFLAEIRSVDTTTGELIDGSEQEDDFGDFEEQIQEKEVKGEGDSLDLESVGLPASKGLHIPDGATEDVTHTGNTQGRNNNLTRRQNPIFEIDTSLINQLFPSSRASEKFPEPEGTIISSTSARKAWYRITRKQTLREYSKGEDDDHYVRVAWKGSAIQAQVNKTVSRWAAEDRIHGRVVLGGRPGAIFGWDEPGDSRHVPSIKSESILGKLFVTAATRSEAATKHTRSTSTALGTPITKRTSLVDASSVAQFSWSSSPVTAGPTSVPLSERTSPDLSRKSPVSASARSGTAPTPASALPHVGHHGRWASVDLPNTQAPSIKRHRASQSINLPAAAVSKASIVSKLDEISYHQESALADRKLANGGSDPVASMSSLNMDINAGDDEWGEMVQSPMSPNPSAFSISEQQLSSPSLDFDKPGDAALTELPTHTRVSIPDVSSTLTSSTSFEAPPVVQNPQHEYTSFPDVDSTILDPPLPYKHEIQKLPQSEPVLANTALPPRDPWSDVDFSIFETPASPKVPAAPRSSASMHADKYPPAKRGPNPETKTRVSSPSTVRGSDTSTETENDETVKRILQGLPDLGYMLR